MTTIEINEYLTQECRFRLKGGKEIYGVIWGEENNREPFQYFFASAYEHRLYLQAKANDEAEICRSIRYPVNPEDIIMVEKLCA